MRQNDTKWFLRRFCWWVQSVIDLVTNSLLDASNKILIWDTVGEDHVTKLEKQTIGKIFDMAWTDDSKRLVAVGQGQAKHGEAFMIDGGASVGEIGNHMKSILSVDVKQTRPYR